MGLKAKSINKTPKHVSRACLECRTRHQKCDGQEPQCGRCTKLNRKCTYVKSHRGGSRKKGVSVKRSPTNSVTKNELSNGEDSSENSSSSTLLTANHNISSSTSKSPAVYPFRDHKSDILPCVKNGLDFMADNPGCKEDCLSVENYNKLPNCMKNPSIHKLTKINSHPLFVDSKENDPLDIVFDKTKVLSSLEDCYISPSLLNNLNVDNFISSFYNSFYNAHPFLPEKEHFHEYIDSIPFKNDLLLAMEIMADGQTTSKYARDLETINYLISAIVTYVRQIGRDFVSLQTMLLLAMISHISSLHDLSNMLREATVSLALELKMNYIDEENVPQVFLDVNGFLTERDDSSPASKNSPTDTPKDELFNSRRTSNIPRNILIDTVRRTFWELYFFDSIAGTASGNTKSKLATQRCLVLYPDTVASHKFDFKSRAESCKLVNDAISLNIAIQTSTDSVPHLNHMRAALGNWEMKISNPDTFGMPYLIDKHGFVNEGLFEAIVLLNYAGIFTHRPFSFLWRPNVPKMPRCCDKGDPVEERCEPLENAESQTNSEARKIIETRKTIDCANFLMKTLLDTDPGTTCKRTPFLACALAFSSLVHLSAYAWVESHINPDDSDEDNDLNVSASELEVYTEYIKLEIGSILQISRHWSLSAKLITHIAETLARVSPKLYKKVQAGILGLGFNIATVLQSVPPSPTEVSNTTPELFEHKSAKKREARTSSNKSLISPQPNATPSLTSDFMHYSQSLPNPQKLQYKEESNIDTRNQSVASVDWNSYNASDSNKQSNFMNEFAELVNGMNQSGDSEAVPLSVLGFQPENQNFDFLEPISPTSDTGCDWVDKNTFQFESFPNA